jgi:hypothetical protein
MNRSRCGAVVIVLLCVASMAMAQYDYVPEHPRWQSCACEFGAGLGAAALCAPVMTFGVELAFLPVAFVLALPSLVVDEPVADYPPDWMSSTLTVTSLAVTPMVSGLTVDLVGRRMGDSRSPWAAVAGAYCGLAVGVGASYPVWPRDENGRLTGPSYWPYNGWPAFAIAAAGTAIGATFGYALSPLRLVDGIQQGSRLGTPSLTMTRTELPDGSTEYGVSLRLLRVNF